MMSLACLPRYLCVQGGARHQLASIVAQIGCRAPLLVTDAWMSKAGHAHELVEALQTHPYIDRVGVFDNCIPEPTDTCVNEAMDVLRDGNFDCIVGLGGGSPMDVAKAMSVLKPGQAIADIKVPANPESGLPVIALPTTAGTGSEVTKATVITDESSSEKMLCMAPAFQPIAALVDYEYTLSCPPRLTGTLYGRIALADGLDGKKLKEARNINRVIIKERRHLVNQGPPYYLKACLGTPLF